MKKISKIILADDHDIVKFGLETILRQNILKPEILKVSSTNELRNQLLDHKNVDLVILDIKMPGGNTVDIVKDIKSCYEDIKILMYSAHNESYYALKYI
ncbi:MAG: response regulator, partial [Desulfonatronovibrio sp.]